MFVQVGDQVDMPKDQVGQGQGQELDNLKLQSTTEFQYEWNTLVELPMTRGITHCYQQAVLFMVNETKSLYKAVPFYVCFILRCTIY